MRKIISVFQRNYESDRLIRDEVVSGAEWVLAGEGRATRKFDGTCCLIRGGRLFKRHEVKAGRPEPPGFEPAGEVDPVTGKRQGWLPVGDGPEDRWHREALESLEDSLAPGTSLEDMGGTYELCGPKSQGNPEHFAGHVLVPHGAESLDDCPRDFAGIRAYLAARDIEGVVF